MRYKSNDNYVIKDVAGESVLVPLAGSTAKMQNMFTINGTGSDIIAFMQAGLDFEGIVARMNETYAIEDQAQLRSDVSAFIKGLISRGFFSEEQ